MPRKNNKPQQLTSYSYYNNNKLHTITIVNSYTPSWDEVGVHKIFSVSPSKIFLWPNLFQNKAFTKTSTIWFIIDISDQNISSKVSFANFVVFDVNIFHVLMELRVFDYQCKALWGQSMHISSSVIGDTSKWPLVKLIEQQCT
jgi:hypothetical protein